ncbi:MAG: PQQ-like beta-propeller repeat protein [Spirochaetaceae bacterium]|nr:MAG: PQQ-like beta-propeller repeat protein [Spirochaetaceae bacterium]
MRIRHLFKKTFVCTLFILLIVPRTFGDWPQWRGPERNGISSETNWDSKTLARGPRILWKVNVGLGYSSVAVRGNLLYTMGNDRGKDGVYCLDTRTGREVWSYSYPAKSMQYPGPRATPTIDGNLLYALSSDGQLTCFSADRGKIQWRRNIVTDFGTQPPNWGFACSPVIEGELLLLNAGPAGLALYKQSGKLVWSSGSGTGGYATPVVYDQRGKRYAAIFGRRAIYGVEVQTGKQAWSYPWTTDNDVNAADPLVFDNRVFISSNYGAGSALLDISGRQPKVLWRNRSLNSHFSSFVLIDGYIYGNDGFAGRRYGVFRCLDAKTGREQWAEDLGFGSLIAADGKLILLTEQGNLHIAEATSASYQEISSAPSILSSSCWTPPVLCNGLIYLRNHRGELVCLDVRR